MSLLDPSPGQLCDRLGILYRKIVEASLRDLPCSQWAEERDDIWQRLKALPDLGLAAFWSLFFQLFATNAALWEAENMVRHATAHSVGEQLAARSALLRRQTLLNDDRASLIHQIDCLFNPSAQKEKLHE